MPLDDPVESLLAERRRAVHTYSVTHETITRFIYDLSSLVKFIHSEKATKFCEISIIDSTGTTLDKSTVEIFQIFVAFLRYMNSHEVALRNVLLSKKI